ncbi:hypothetical protein L9F63_024939, partial [Diploptera punctata]
IPLKSMSFLRHVTTIFSAKKNDVGDFLIRHETTPFAFGLSSTVFLMQYGFCDRQIRTLCLFAVPKSVPKFWKLLNNSSILVKMSHDSGHFVLTRKRTKRKIFDSDSIFLLNSNMISKMKSPDQSVPLELFSLQLLHRKVQFTACGFFPLDFTLLYSIVGA